MWKLLFSFKQKLVLLLWMTLIINKHRCENLKSYTVFLYEEATHQHIRWLDDLTLIMFKPKLNQEL
jgi:hypothetical protein